MRTTKDHSKPLFAKWIILRSTFFFQTTPTAKKCVTGDILELKLCMRRAQRTKTIYYIRLLQLNKELKAVSPLSPCGFIILYIYPLPSYVLLLGTASVTYIPSVYQH